MQLWLFFFRILSGVGSYLHTDVSGQPIGPMFKGMAPCPLEMGPIRSPETSVTTYPEEQRRKRHGGGNLKSRDV